MAQTPNKTLRMDEEETFEAGEAITLKDGAHRGLIIDVHGEKSSQGYEYLQLVIKEKETGIDLRYGCAFPSFIDEKDAAKGRKPITTASKLGKLLLAFGKPVGPGFTYSIKQMREALEGKECQFQTINEKAAKGSGTFANIIDETVKLAK